jgi:hypothetical protein
VSLVIHLLWAGVAVYFVYTAAAVAREFKPVAAPSVLPPPPQEIPEDLTAVAMQERESWAQEEVLRAIRERYEELKDWNKVRAAVGVGRID